MPQPPEKTGCPTPGKRAFKPRGRLASDPDLPLGIPTGRGAREYCWKLPHKRSWGNAEVSEESLDARGGASSQGATG